MISSRELFEVFDEYFGNNYMSSDGDYGVDVGTIDRNAFDTIADKINEQNRVVIPQFVADWVERAKNLNGDPINAIWGMYEDETYPIYAWVTEGNNSDILMRAMVNVYEVEEQKYNVKFKVKSSFGTVGIFLYKQGDEVLAGDNFDVYRPEEDKFRLTEQEIKDFDPRCWLFAVEVAE